MAERAESVIPVEADLDRAPGLLAGANSVELTPQACNLEYVGDYELAPGKRLIDSTPEDRLMMTATWSMELQDSRLASIGLV